MKKIITAALAALMLLCLSVGCGNQNSTASPGSLLVPSHTPSIGQEKMPAEEDARKAICNVTWLDTDSFDEYTLSEDGSFSVVREETAATESGAWELTTDGNGMLSLTLRFEVSAEITLYELELYEASIFAIDEVGEAYIWLLQD